MNDINVQSTTEEINVTQEDVVVSVEQVEEQINAQVVEDDINVEIGEGAQINVDAQVGTQGVTSIVQITATAGENISAHKGVIVDFASGKAYTADNDTLSHMDNVTGVSVNAANTGDRVTIRTLGRLTDQSFSFSEGPVFLGSNGALVQSRPSASFLAQLGIAETENTLFVKIERPIKQA